MAKLPKDLLTQMREWAAYGSVGPSTVRGPGRAGLGPRLRKLLQHVDLQMLLSCRTGDFSEWLNAETDRLERLASRCNGEWGVVRKVLNIFLRNATYNKHLCEHFQLQRFEPVLEVPLDSYTANGIISLSPLNSLPRWQGLKRLEQDESDQFQNRARDIASEWSRMPGMSRMVRVHLDTYLWTLRKKQGKQGKVR